jgi:alpha-beta hydrolase superfamily lysophospholipase
MPMIQPGKTITGLAGNAKQMGRKVLLAAALLALAACTPLLAPHGPDDRIPVIETDSFTTADGTVLPLRHWDAAQPHAFIIGLHGMSDYSNAFALPAKFWAGQGITTYAYDQRGFGAAPHPGEWAGGDVMRSDLADFTAALRRKYPGLPVYALGESMGGAVLLTALAGAHPPHLDGAILVAPAVWSRADMPLLYRGALFVTAHLAPWLVLSNNAGASIKQVMASDNVPMLRALGRDPLFQKKTRVAALYGLVDLMDAARAAPAHLENPPQILFLYGAQDQLIPAAPTKAVIAELGSRAEVRRYPHGYHMLLRDLEGPTVWRDIADWIGKGPATKPAP